MGQTGDSCHGAGAFTLAFDGIAQAAEPLKPQEPHDTFQLAATTTSDIVVVAQYTITGDLLVVPPPEPVNKIKRAR